MANQNAGICHVLPVQSMSEREKYLRDSNMDEPEHSSETRSRSWLREQEIKECIHGGNIYCGTLFFCGGNGGFNYQNQSVPRLTPPSTSSVFSVFQNISQTLFRYQIIFFLNLLSFVRSWRIRGSNAASYMALVLVFPLFVLVGYSANILWRKWHGCMPLLRGNKGEKGKFILNSLQMGPLMRFFLLFYPHYFPMLSLLAVTGNGNKSSFHISYLCFYVALVRTLVCFLLMFF